MRSADTALTRAVVRAQFSGGNEAVLLQGGDELFPAMVRAIASARREIWLATYIYTDEGMVKEVTRALADAARRGVSVRVLLDGFGCRVDMPVLR